MIASRMIFALALGLACAAGCKKESQTGQPTTPLDPGPENKGDPKTDSKTDPKGDSKSDPNPKIEPPPPMAVHELDPTKHAIPTTPVTGQLNGLGFTPTAMIEGESLVFSVEKTGQAPEHKLSLKLRPTAPNSPFENRKVIVAPTDAAGPLIPELWIERSDRPNAPEVFRNGYALTLMLGTRKQGKLPGSVYLSLPDGEKSVIAGTFTAEFPRQPTEPPGTDDVPYVQGSVLVRAAPADSRLVVGYAAHPTPELFCFGQSQITLGPLVAGQPRTVREETHKMPAVITNLVGGDGATIPGRYDHTRLPAGRYLIFAQLAGGGPVAWKWVNVTQNAALTLDLALDANLTGGVEVTVPPTTLGKVQLLPADEPGTPAIDPALATVIALQLQLERNIEARKALYKNLAPGKYEVRVGGESRVIDIVAGKTSEVDFGKKPEPPKAEPAPDPKPKM